MPARTQARPKASPKLKTFRKAKPKLVGLQNRPSAVRMLAARELEERAFDMRIAGKSYREIGKACNVTTQAAYYAVMRVLEQTEETIKESAKKLRSMELDRLDRIQNVLWPRIDGSNGNPPDQFAIDRYMKIAERRARLTGIDAPTKLQHSGDEDNPIVVRQLSDTELDRELHSIAVIVGFTPLADTSSQTTLLGTSTGEASSPVTPEPKNGTGKLAG